MSTELKLPTATLPSEQQSARIGTASTLDADTRKADDGRAADDAAEVCFAALFAWLTEVVPAENLEGHSAAPRSGDETDTPSSLRGALLRSFGGPFDSADGAAGRFTLATAPTAEAAEALSSEFAQSLQGAASGRSDGTHRAGAIDLSFLSVAASSDAPQLAREMPNVYTATASEPRAQLGTELGQRVVLMVEQGVHDARVRVHPEHLGPIEIRVRVEGDAAQVTFHSAHGAVRDALADAVPRLREMLGASGLDLAQVDIGADDPSYGEAPEHGAATAEYDAGDALEPPVEAEPEDTASPTVVRRGLVDTFA